MSPTPANGKICYVELPATDVARSADFYRAVFDWNVRTRGDGNLAFDDTTGEVSGSWVPDRPAAAEPGLLLYIMVDSVADAVDAVVANGCEVVQPIGADAPEITARFRDPGGNVIGLTSSPRPDPALRVTPFGWAPFHRDMSKKTVCRALGIARAGPDQAPRFAAGRRS